MKDEFWTCRDGRKIAVGDMDESHVRNTLRMILRKCRLAKAAEEIIDIQPLEDGERPDNHQALACLRAQHGSAVDVRGKSVGGMDGADVYVNGEWRGWYGGIRGGR